MRMCALCVLDFLCVFVDLQGAVSVVCVCVSECVCVFVCVCMFVFVCEEMEE
jgi:hypothetical protein